MAITNELVKFLYGATGTPSKVAGEISFHSGNQAIYVGDGDNAILVTSSVKDATFVDSVLTVTKIDGTSFTLNFSDVASAKETMAVFAALETSIKANTTAITNLGTAVDTSIKNLDASYKAADASLKEAYEAADASLSERIAKFESGDNSVAKQIENAIDGLDSSANSDNDFFKLEVVEENGKVTAVNFTNKDLASAAALAGVKATAEAAATQVDFNAHKNNGDIHITAQERTDWNAAKTAIDTFLKDASLTGDVIDTLTEIQDYIASDASAADKLVKDLSDVSTRAEKGISDASAAQAAADAAQDDVDALEGTVSTLSGNFDTHSKDTTIHITAQERTAWNAAEQNAKDYAKTYADGLASNYDKAGDASKAEAAAKTYADAITVNGQAQSGQEITLTGVNIKVGGTGTNKEASLSTAVEDLYTKVDVASKAGVQSLAVNADSSKYAEVDKASGAVTLKIKKVALADATSTNTGVADAYDVKTSIATAKSEAISTVKGTAADASNAETVAGAKKYADEKVAAAALRWGVLN